MPYNPVRKAKALRANRHGKGSSVAHNARQAAGRGKLPAAAAKPRRRPPNPLRRWGSKFNGTGVYIIFNSVNGKSYVGSAARSLKERCAGHHKRLVDGSHINKHLQAAWNKYGDDAFKFYVLENCNSEECLTREQYWIDRFKSADREYGYNKSPTAGSQLGFRHSADTKRKIASLKIGLRPSEETRAKLSEALRNRVTKPETRAKRAAAAKGNQHCKGRRLTEDHRAKLVESNRSRLITPEYRAKLSNAHKGVTQSPETIAKRAAKLRGKKASTETKAKLSAARYNLSPEVKARIAEATAKSNRARVITPEMRAKMSASAKARRHRERTQTV